jgi:hypothetical protein
MSTIEEHDDLAEQRVAMEGLNVLGYSGKWELAQKMAAFGGEYADDRHLLPYWERARLFFFELGGERVDGQKC